MRENQQSLRLWLARPLIIGLGLAYVKLLPSIEPKEIMVLLGVMITVPCAIDPYNRGAWLLTILGALTYGGLAVLLRFTV